jgi:mono/diheme cytochrome c family protein
VKPHFLALAASGSLLSVSLCFAQNEAKTGKSARIVPHDYSELTKAPDKARLRANPFENEPDAVIAGQFLFENHCAECHGNAGVGGKKAPSLRAPEVQDAPPGTLFWLLTSGVSRKGMPVWSKLPEAQRWQIVRYLKSLGPKTNSVTEKSNSPAIP